MLEAIAIAALIACSASCLYSAQVTLQLAREAEKTHAALLAMIRRRLEETRLEETKEGARDARVR